MQVTLRALERRVPAPEIVELPSGPAYRYTEQSPQQALVQKLARVVTGLKGAWILLENGLFQEQAVMQRVLDEINDDVVFICHGIIFSDWTPLHQRYLEAFYMEEFDKETALGSTQKRPMPPRDKIRAYLAQRDGAAFDPSTGTESYRTISKAYSGYVHAASPQIMDMYGGTPPRFHVNGMLGTPREEEHRDDLWNYFYRSVISFAFAAKAFGDDALFESIRTYADDFAQQVGKDYKGEK